MYPAGVIFFLALVILWLIALSYFFWRKSKLIDNLLPKNMGDGEKLVNKFNELLDEIASVKRNEQILNKNFRSLSKQGLGYIQKIEVLRYNPYEDTGGDQSFSIAFSDGKLNGFILTSLHSRGGTRVYVKVLKEGIPEIELSKEESLVLKKLISSND